MSGTRVGILIASLQQGGAERVALGLLDGLHAAGVDAFLLTIDRNREMVPTADAERSRLLSDRILRLSGSDIRMGTLSKSLFVPWQWLALLRAARRLRLDVVLSIMERANILSLLTPLAARKLLSVHSYPSTLLSQKTPFKRFLVVRSYKTLLRGADRIVCVSREAAANLKALFPAIADRCTVIYNACSVSQVQALGQSPLPEEHASFFDGPVVVTCGRLAHEKGHGHLLRAFREICREDAETRLAIVGKGVLEADLVRLRDDLGLGDRVLFPGFQANPMPWISRARIFVLPSIREGFPNSLLEAMALGTPVIASDCRSGPRELLAPDTDPTRKTAEIDVTPIGTLVPPPDGERRPAGQPLTREEWLLANALKRVLRDPQLRSAQGRASRERAAEFNPERILPQWVRLLRELH